MKVAIVGGTAGLGFGLAVRLAHSGAEVVIGSRQAEKAVMAADAAAKASGAELQGGANPDVVAGAEAVIVAVPFPGQAPIYKGIKEALGPGTAVIDCTVPLASEVGGKATRLLGVWEGSAAQQARGILGKEIPLASAFHTVMAAALEDASHPIDQDILVCGDPPAKETARRVVELISGARFIDCGPLENARILESLTALLIGINIRNKLTPGAGIHITGL
jgi:8-hydroxy-5-deazaflavin:NADPH oxidoreductase